jgi:hypothetical protein
MLSPRGPQKDDCIDQWRSIVGENVLIAFEAVWAQSHVQIREVPRRLLRPTTSGRLLCRNPSVQIRAVPVGYQGSDKVRTREPQSHPTDQAVPNGGPLPGFCGALLQAAYHCTDQGSSKRLYSTFISTSTMTSRRRNSTVQIRAGSKSGPLRSCSKDELAKQVNAEPEATQSQSHRTDQGDFQGRGVGR